MTRLYSLASCLYASSALALAVLVPLTVSEDAFTDRGSSCTNCSSACCYDECNGDPSASCQISCCQSACGSDAICLHNCLTYPAAKCDPSACTARKDCTQSAKADCADRTGCGPKEGGRDACTCEPSGNACDCRQK